MSVPFPGSVSPCRIAMRPSREGGFSRFPAIHPEINEKSSAPVLFVSRVRCFF